MKWSLTDAFSDIHQDVQSRLSAARKTSPHPTRKGSAAENKWLNLLTGYLPRRYDVITGQVVDSKGGCSDQIDLIVFDRQYSTIIFELEGEYYVPAESIYAIFEVKQTLNPKNVRYAKEKVASVRALHRTSLPIPSAAGLQPAKDPQHVIGGVLSLESEWKPAIGKPLKSALSQPIPNGQLDIGCIAAHCMFHVDESGRYSFTRAKPATAFLFELFARLQACATVPMMDIRAYASWLDK